MNELQINHTKINVTPAPEGNFGGETATKDSYGQPGMLTLEQLREQERLARVKEELMRVAKVYDGDPDDLTGEKKVSPKEAYYQNIEYAKGVTSLVLKMREYLLKKYGSQDASKLLEENSGMTGVDSVLKKSSFAVGDEINLNPDFWNKNPDDKKTDQENRNNDGNNPVVDMSSYAARRARREAPAPTNSSSSYYYPEEHAA